MTVDGATDTNTAVAATPTAPTAQYRYSHLRVLATSNISHAAIATDIATTVQVTTPEVTAAVGCELENTLQFHQAPGPARNKANGAIANASATMDRYETTTAANTNRAVPATPSRVAKPLPAPALGAVSDGKPSWVTATNQIQIIAAANEAKMKVVGRAGTPTSTSRNGSDEIGRVELSSSSTGGGPL